MLDINNGVVHLDVTTLQWLMYTVLPIVVDFVTKRFADGRVKAAVLTLLALVTAIVQEALATDGDLNLPSVIGKFVTALVTAYVTHTYVWKPLHLTGDRGVIQKALPAGAGPVDPVKVAKQNTRAGTGAS
jgi:peptidoglycan/LPS O-acetylase OafA/YrhL